jgi:hypothetical protein
MPYDPMSNNILTRVPAAGGARPGSQGPMVPQQAPPPATTAAGRFSNPTAEIGRLLDELERNRRQLADINTGPTDADIATQQRIQQALLTPALAQISGQFGARGLSGSSLESVKRSLMANQVAVQGEQQLQDIGMQRANFEVGRNRQLFDSLTNSISLTGSRGAPGTQVKKKGGGILGAIGGVLGGVAGSVLGPVGTALGSRLGGYLGGQVGGGGGVEQYQSPAEYVPPYAQRVG